MFSIVFETLLQDDSSTLDSHGMAEFQALVQRQCAENYSRGLLRRSVVFAEYRGIGRPRNSVALVLWEV
ncbi:MAG: hypothetical protein Q8S20_11310 [Sulfuritalea sp.]|nr:hypothetical protein [Sulfuritalea sp.]